MIDRDKHIVIETRKYTADAQVVQMRFVSIPEALRAQGTIVPDVATDLRNEMAAILERCEVCAEETVELLELIPNNSLKYYSDTKALIAQLGDVQLKFSETDLNPRG